MLGELVSWAGASRDVGDAISARRLQIGKETPFGHLSATWSHLTPSGSLLDFIGNLAV